MSRNGGIVLSVNPSRWGSEPVGGGKITIQGNLVHYLTHCRGWKRRKWESAWGRFELKSWLVAEAFMLGGRTHSFLDENNCKLLLFMSGIHNFFCGWWRDRTIHLKWFLWWLKPSSTLVFLIHVSSQILYPNGKEKFHRM